MAMSSEDEGCKEAVAFIEKTGGVGEMVGAEYNVEDSFSKVIGGVVRVISMEKGKISCILKVKPSVLVEVVVDASVIRSGREVTVVAVDFRLKEPDRLAYVSRATLHKTPLSNL